MTVPWSEAAGLHHARRLPADAAGIAAAAALLRAGGLVAFPTETVYGLGADALKEEAVAGIFRAKGRPADDPLIVHVASPEEVGHLAELVPAVSRLAAAFWPGPLTILLRKKSVVPDLVTASLPTVAIRVPQHPVARALLQAANVPIAAPSANLFTRPSPTRAEHVLDDLGDRIDAVVDGGSTPIGVESTIVDLTTVPPRLLRPGGVPLEELEEVLRTPIAPALPRSQPGPLRAPGQLETHYAPRTPLILVSGQPEPARLRLREEVARAVSSGQQVGVLLLDEDVSLISADACRVAMGRWNDPRTSAQRLFDALRTLDQCGLDALLARDLADPGSGLGRALADRLRRAAGRVILLGAGT